MTEASWGAGGGGEIIAIDSRYAAANRCVVIEDRQGRYLREQDSVYRADALSREDATPFYFKPSALGQYLLLSEYQREAPALIDNERGEAMPAQQKLLGLETRGTIDPHSGVVGINLFSVVAHRSGHTVVGRIHLRPGQDPKFVFSAVVEKPVVSVVAVQCPDHRVP